MTGVVKDRMEFKKAIDAEWDEKLKNGRLLDNSQSGIVRGAGGTPQIDTEKKYTPEDVRSGASRAVLQSLLEND